MTKSLQILGSGVLVYMAMIACSASESESPIERMVDPVDSAAAAPTTPTANTATVVPPDVSTEQCDSTTKVATHSYPGRTSAALARVNALCHQINASKLNGDEYAYIQAYAFVRDGKVAVHCSTLCDSVTFILPQ